MKKIILSISALILILVLAMSGCATLSRSENRTEAAAVTPLQTQGKLKLLSAVSDTAGIITPEDALENVHTAFGETEVTVIDVDLDDGAYEFDVSADGVVYKCDVNAKTGEILKKHVDCDDHHHCSAHGTLPATEPASTMPIETPPPTNESTPSSLTVEEAKAIVLAHLGDANAEFLQAERDDGKYEFDVLSKGLVYEYEVSIRSGAILEAHADGRLPAASTISMDDAKAIVLNHLGDTAATFHEAELDDGEYHFEVISNGIKYEYEIDARTGAVLEAERDN